MLIFNRFCCLTVLVTKRMSHVLNKQVPCGYSINVRTNYNKQSKQTYYRGDSTVSKFCKEIHNIAQDLLNIEKKPMQKLSNDELMIRDTAKYCHICKKSFW